MVARENGSEKNSNKTVITLEVPKVP